MAAFHFEPAGSLNDTDIGRVGIQVCYDNAFPEGARALAVNGAEIICLPIWGEGRAGDTVWPCSPRMMALNNGELGPDDFVHAAGGCNLKPRARRSLIQAYERRLDQEAAHPVFGYQLSTRRMIQVQARLFARWLLEEIPDYPHYMPR